MQNDRLIVIPLNVDKTDDEEILFDAGRDNNGKGINPDTIIRMIKEIQHERN
jgi:hypothetical protein